MAEPAITFKCLGTCYCTGSTENLAPIYLYKNVDTGNMVIQTGTEIQDLFYSEQCDLFAAELDGDYRALNVSSSNVDRLDEFRPVQVRLNEVVDESCSDGSTCFSGQSSVISPIDGLEMIFDIQYNETIEDTSTTVIARNIDGKDLELKSVQECALIPPNAPTQTFLLTSTNTDGTKVVLYFKVEIILPTSIDPQDVFINPSPVLLNGCYGGSRASCTPSGSLCSTDKNCCSANCQDGVCGVRVDATEVSDQIASTFLHGMLIVPFFTVSENTDLAKKGLEYVFGLTDSDIIFESIKDSPVASSNLEAIPIQNAYLALNEWQQQVSIPFKIQFNADSENVLLSIQELSTVGLSELALFIGADDRAVFLEGISIGPSENLAPDPSDLQIYSLFKDNQSSLALGAWPGLPTGELPSHAYSLGVGWFVLFCTVAAILMAIVGWIWTLKSQTRPPPIESAVPIRQRKPSDPAPSTIIPYPKPYPPRNYPQAISPTPPPPNANAPRYPKRSPSFAESDNYWIVSPSSGSASRPPSTRNDRAPFSTTNPDSRTESDPIGLRYQFSDLGLNTNRSPTVANPTLFSMGRRREEADEADDESDSDTDEDSKYGKVPTRDLRSTQTILSVLNPMVHMKNKPPDTLNTAQDGDDGMILSSSSESSIDESPISGLKHLPVPSPQSAVFGKGPLPPLSNVSIGRVTGTKSGPSGLRGARIQPRSLIHPPSLSDRLSESSRDEEEERQDSMSNETTVLDPPLVRGFYNNMA